MSIKNDLNQTNNINPPNKAVYITLPIAILSIACVAGLISFIFIRELVIIFSDQNPLNAPSITEQTGEIVIDEQGNPVISEETSGVGQVEIEPSLNPWDGAGRVTILLLGLDYRDWAADEGPSRSDTMILVTLDPLTNSGGMLSIPRDLWAAIPGFQHGKINTAHYLGEAYNLPGGGPGLAVKTVEQLLGVPINYYAQIDFDAFIRFIDEIGGVKIDVPEKITVDLLGSGFKTKKTLQPGVQRLPGEWALAYARARYTEGGDFDRAFRQQQVILAIRDQILSLELLPTLIKNAPSLYNEIISGVNTNLSLDEVIKLALLAQNVPQDHIQKGIIDKNYVLFGTSPDGLSILIPLKDKIQLLRDKIFTTFGLGPETPGNTQERMRAESARVALYDGSGNPDILNRTEAFLREQGMNIIQVAPSGEPYGATVIIDYTGNPHSLQYFVELMGIKSNNIRSQFNPTSQVDVEVYLGSDWAAGNTLP
jgi:LCP family protein required for cell wall assembly